VWAGGAGSELVTIDFGCRPIYAADGSIPFLVAEGRDISEKKQAELQLADTVQRLADVNRQLTELDALRRDFIANVSHELRTPLTIIMAGTDRLLERADEEHARRHLVRMRDAGAVLLKRVNDLLSAAALEQRRPLRVSEVDLAALVRHVAAQYEGLTTDRGQRLVVESHEACAASIDGDLTESMLSNLVGNAVKFTPDGGTIRVTVTRWGERAIIEVADSGPGIPTGMRTSVLEPFRQVEGSATRRHEGTGLGLAIAAQVARRHGGELVVADASEGGALIRVTLPLLPNGTSTGAAPAPEPSKALHVDVSALRAELKRSSAPDRPWRNDGRPKVLVVDDNVDLGDYLVELLEPHYDVTLTRDGLQAFEQAKANAPDVLITDFMMPGISGLDLLRMLRGEPGLQRVPVVMLTAKADAAHRVEALREGAVDYLLKPFDASELLARVANILQARPGR
jgi:signal transduction histidine kinase